MWNSIVSNRYENNYISQGCKLQIQQAQEQIFKQESENLLENLIASYNLNRRKDTNRGSTINKLLDTINNLFYGDIDSFENTIILDEEQAMTQSLPIEFKNKLIPPLNWASFNKSDIKYIQDAYSKFNETGNWDYSVVETSNKERLFTHVNFRYSLFAKAYHDLSKSLRQYNGVINNTFESEIDSDVLARLRVDLMKHGFIAKEADRLLFIKIFQGYYLLQSERINWLKSLDCLRYFIITMNILKHQKEYGKWEVASNCFLNNNVIINPDTLRKATKIDKSPIEKQQLESILSSIK